MAAVSDVAVKLKLQGAKNFQRDAGGASRSIDKLGKSTSTAARRAKVLDAANGKVNRGFAAIGVAARTGAALGIGAMATEAFRATKGWADHLAITRRTSAVINSTGHAARVSAGHVGTLSDALERQTGVDGDLIQGGANLLLTFTNVRNGVGKNNQIFDQATGTIVNMSKALGQDTKSSAIQLGKALNDPVKGVSALSKVGVSFTEQQKKQIESLVKSGKAMDAQKIILRELGKEFPKVKATPFERLMVTIHGLEDSLGKALLPVFNKAVKALNRFLTQMQNGTGAGGAFVQRMKDIATFVGTQVIPRIKSIVGWFTNLVKGFREGNTGAVLLVAGLGAVVAGLGAFIVLVKIAKMIQAVTKAWALLNLVFGASPVGLIIIALAALAFGIFIAYKKIGVFRRAVHGVFNWITKNWPLLVGILAGPLGMAVVQVIKHWHSIKNGASSAINFVRKKFSAFVGFFRGLPKRIGRAARGMFNGIRDAFRGALNWIIRKWNGLQFKTPSINLGKLGKIGGKTIGVPHIPELATGGTITRSGLALVGERGPELVTLPRAASVVPLGSGGGMELAAPVVLNVDGRELARATARFLTTQQARRAGR